MYYLQLHYMYTAWFSLPVVRNLLHQSSASFSLQSVMTLRARLRLRRSIVDAQALAHVLGEAHHAARALGAHVVRLARALSVTHAARVAHQHAVEVLARGRVRETDRPRGAAALSCSLESRAA